ncbi:Eco57I restriction-modification methylase domain-containing protein [Micromonospora echinospora]
MSATARNQVFSAVHTIGGLLPADMLVRISEGRDVSGSAPADYRIVGSRSVRDDAERHWDYLKSIWAELRKKLPVAPDAETPADPTGLAVREWLEPLFNTLGFGLLSPTGAGGISTDDGAKTFPISHRWHHVPIHLITWNARLDVRPAPGAVPPQSLVQECLNRSDAHLWAVLANGRQIRLLRDSSALATASYVEFDLEAIFDGELFSEFVLLYRLLHVSRFDIADGAAPTSCWLEKWRVEAIASGTRALDHLRDGVQNAITTLGTGFLRHPANGRLRQQIDVDALHNALLRLAYRLIFLCVAEDRDALLAPEAPEHARRRYADYFSSARLRRQALRRRGTSHTDLYQALRIVLDALGDEHGRPELGLPGLGGLFDDAPADEPLHGLSLANADLLEAVRHLSRVRDEKSSRWRQVDYRNMGAEELGSIYESLLELVPKHSPDEGTFELVNRLGNDRKKTGSYYTPTSLIETVLDSSLDPVIEDAQKRGEQKAAQAGDPDATRFIVDELLGLTVCDPACGSGHFLVAAARRIAKRVAAVRESNPEPTLDAVRHALHEVVARCLYGVDLNPMAVELAKVSLWLEALEPGKPLGFLDAHLRHGNALIGATPALLRDGIPDKAFKPIEGDNAQFAAALARRNAVERSGQISTDKLLRQAVTANAGFASELKKITGATVYNLRDVRRQADAFRDWSGSADYRKAVRVADAWCAAFAWYKAKEAPAPITHEVFVNLQGDADGAAPEETLQEIDRLRNQYRFFHWHLAFPEIFAVSAEHAGDSADPVAGWVGGFSCVLGNPPWDKVDFEDKKYFSIVNPIIAAVAGAARRMRIERWEADDPDGGQRYREARRAVKATFHFAGDSGVFPMCAKGLTAKGVNSLQTDQLFAERATTLIRPTGRIGYIIPTVIATGAAAQYLFDSLTRRGAISSLYDFENIKPVFIGVHSSYKFCLLSLAGRALWEPAPRFASFLTDTTDLDDPSRAFELGPDEIKLISPNTGSLPTFRTRRDADLTAEIYRRIPVLWNEHKEDGNAWRISFKNLFNMSDDSDLFRTREQLEAEGWALDGNVFSRAGVRMLPLYEGKMAHHFDHRWNSFFDTGSDDRKKISTQEKDDPAGRAMPRYWIAETGLIPTVRKNKEADVPGVDLRLREVDWDRDWLYGWRDVCRTTDERTAIPALIPRTAVGHKLPLMLPRVSPELIAGLCAVQSSLVFDFVSRQKVGGISMGLFVWKQLPVPTPASLQPHVTFIVPRVVELTYTASDMVGLAADLGDPAGAEPFRWDEERRAQIRAEMDAYCFHLYGIEREDVDYILESFQTENGGLKNNEIAKYGSYRTKELVLAEYDRMASAGLSLTQPLVDGENYTPTLNPPPGHGPRHPAR